MNTRIGFDRWLHTHTQPPRNKNCVSQCVNKPPSAPHTKCMNGNLSRAGGEGSSGRIAAFRTLTHRRDRRGDKLLSSHCVYNMSCSPPEWPKEIKR